ncbi:MAG: peptide chain release factor aRF-1 [archaeon]|nr:peptide chain release factor aRF-1 [archaeon]
MAESESIQKARYDFKKVMQEIMGVRGRGTELISLYVPATRQISDVMAYLRDEYSQSSNIKSKSTMKNVQGAIDSIMSRLKTYKVAPPNGIVVFCGEIPRAGDQTKMVQYVVEPPEAITTFLYRCDSVFYTEPLEAMLADKKSYGLIVIDRREATLGVLTGSRIVPMKHFDSLVPSKHHQGGQSSLRFERLIRIAAHEFFKKVADSATDIFLSRTELAGLLIGGPGATKDFFIDEGYLHHELQKKVISTFDVGYTDESGLKELVDVARDSIQDIDLMEEKEYIQRFFREIRKTDGGLSAYGEDEVRSDIGVGAVDVVLLSEDVNKRRISVVCPSGHKYEDTVSSVDDRVRCKICGTISLVVANEDLIDNFFELASEYNTDVKIISSESEEGQMLMTAFGGIAAILRYKV